VVFASTPKPVAIVEEPTPVAEKVQQARTGY